MQIKTTLYDIIGYILPGFLLAFLISLGSKHLTNNTDIMFYHWTKIESLKWPEIMIICFVLYIAGHIISSISSLIIESWMLKTIDYEKTAGIDIFKEFKEKLETRYHCKPDTKAFRLCVCHVEANQPQVYSTAFTFLSFYGMARNISFLFFVFSVWEAVLCIYALRYNEKELILPSIAWSLSAFALSAITFYTYKRFLKYYRQHIICGFILQKK